MLRVCVLCSRSLLRRQTQQSVFARGSKHSKIAPPNLGISKASISTAAVISGSESVLSSPFSHSTVISLEDANPLAVFSESLSGSGREGPPSIGDEATDKFIASSDPGVGSLPAENVVSEFVEEVVRSSSGKENSIADNSVFTGLAKGAEVAEGAVSSSVIPEAPSSAAAAFVSPPPLELMADVSVGAVTALPNELGGAKPVLPAWQSVLQVGGGAQEGALAASGTVGGAATHWGWVQLGVSGVIGVLQFFHWYCGLPWWEAIIAATLFVRVGILPLTIVQLRNSARLANIGPEMEVLRAKMSAGKSGDAAARGEALAAYEQLSLLYKKHGCTPWKSFLPAVASGLIFIAFFLAIQDLAADPSSGFTSGGAGSVVDLSARDASYVLVLLSAVTMFAALELGAESLGQAQQPHMRNIMRFACVAMPFFTYKLPTAVMIYWTASNIVSIAQAALLRSAAFRSAFNIPAVTAAPTVRTTATITSLVGRLLAQKAEAPPTSKLFRQPPLARPRRT